jgi:hypothetical protein
MKHVEACMRRKYGHFGCRVSKIPSASRFCFRIPEFGNTIHFPDEEVEPGLEFPGVYDPLTVKAYPKFEDILPNSLQ